MGLCVIDCAGRVGRLLRATNALACLSIRTRTSDVTAPKPAHAGPPKIATDSSLLPTADRFDIGGLPKSFFSFVFFFFFCFCFVFFFSFFSLSFCQFTYLPRRMRKKCSFVKENMQMAPKEGAGGT